MKAYISDKMQGAPKFKVLKIKYVPGFAKGVSSSDKLITKNANRSRKKVARLEAKINIQNI